MKTAIKLACISLMMLGLSAVPGRAQLTSHLDEHGNLVFTNEDHLSPVTVKSTHEASSRGPITPTKPAASDPIVPVAANVITREPGAPPASIAQLVQQSAEKHRVDPALVRAVISTESNWNPRAVSSKGALGLMQLIPGTARQLGVRNAFDPAQNVDAGVRYLSMLLQRYNGDLHKALAAYNAGPGAVDRFGGVPNYRETRNYVQKVTSTYFRPGFGSQPRGFEEASARPIYRTTDAEGRVVFVNE